MKISSSRKVSATELDVADQTGTLFRLEFEEAETSSLYVEYLVRVVYKASFLDGREGRKELLGLSSGLARSMVLYGDCTIQLHERRGSRSTWYNCRTKQTNETKIPRLSVRITVRSLRTEDILSLDRDLLDDSFSLLYISYAL